MLAELKIENFALVKDLEIAFQDGFNVLTGESGAGKSLIVESLNFVLGGKIKSARLPKEETIRVQAVFQTSGIQPEILANLKESGILEDENLILMRKLYPSGRNLYHINGEMVPLNLFKELGETLVDVHSQMDSQYLLKPANQREILDQASEPPAREILSSLARLHKEYKQVSSEIENLRNLELERNRRIDWIGHEISEIEEANLQPGEDAELEKTRIILSNREKISNLSRSVHESLEGERGASELLARVSKDLAKWAEIDGEIENLCQELDLAQQNVLGISSVCREKGEAVGFDEGKLEFILGRIHKIDGLKRKYGSSIDEILAYLEESKKKLGELSGCADRINELEKELERLSLKWTEMALEMSKIRKKSATRLNTEISQELSDLGMKNARFEIMVKSSEGNASDEKENVTFNVTPYGLDKVEFFIRTNPGEPLRPLALIASGGEISRVMLALKNVFARFRNFSTLVLDEIDVGIGGATAESVGEKLRQISRFRQVICITHLPMIAALADVHYQIEKTLEGDAARTILTPVSGKNRVLEMARMIAGEKAPQETRKVAEKLLRDNKENRQASMKGIKRR